MTNTNEYLERRQLLFSKLKDNSITIIGSWPEQKLNEDVEFLYKQNPNLYYLTGWTEPHTILVLAKTNGKAYNILFVPPKDISQEVWTGKRNGKEGAVEYFGVNAAYDNTKFKDIISEIFNDKNYTTIYYDCPDKNSDEWQYYIESVSGHAKESYGIPWIDLKPIIELQRVKKTDFEIDLIRKSCQLSAKAHILAMNNTFPNMNECQIDGLINGYLMWNRCKRLAYPNIVASGNNATTLHYENNDSLMNDGNLLLIDSGGELDYYASDITRTYPISGKFSKEQKEIYNIVLKAQQTCIEQIKPGLTLADLQELSCIVIIEGLLELGLLIGSVEENLENKTYRKFYMHGLGHYLGLDVHDCKTVGKDIEFEPGFVFTVEPGIYISEDLLDVPKEYRGIGIRIEDDVVVTESGCEVLSKDVPKEINEIESIVGTKCIDFHIMPFSTITTV